MNRRQLHAYSKSLRLLIKSKRNQLQLLMGFPMLSTFLFFMVVIFSCFLNLHDRGTSLPAEEASSGREILLSEYVKNFFSRGQDDKLNLDYYRL
ncbi:hypothetical protein LIER_43181 [Lithospermum erythrorhizon]|uniref:Uncharacterized protein n=1 Tax=Lithospermum erythrorhizon TaxID=34254 RepID=A0AAV3PMW1_LITER